MKSAVHSLEKHPDHIRIQKLLYFVYAKLWISDVKAIDGLSITRLLNLLVEDSKSIEQLEIKLIKNAERLNKADTYLQLAHHIIKTLHQQNPSPTKQSVKPYDRFELRHAIMQVLNPYKAKAVLIALYYAQPSSSSSHPVAIKTLANVSLDELLRKTIQLYPSLPQFEAALKSLNHFPDDIQLEERTQLSQTLKEAIRPYLLTDSPSHSDDCEEADLDPDLLCTILMSPTPKQTASVSQYSLCSEDPS